MELTAEARKVLDRALRRARADEAGRQEVEELIAALPQDRVVFYQNVDSNPIGDLPRYSVHIRLQHMMTFVTFLALAFTGLPIKFFEHFWAVPLNDLVGGIGVSRIIHRTLAAVMIFSMVYHVLTIVGGTFMQVVRGRFELRRTIIPTLKDLRDFRDDMLYLAGRRDQRPMMDKFMYKQKLHYFAAAFGNMVMVFSGSAFLFPDIWASILPADIAPHFQELMRLSHPHEALLALLVIAFWHWYNVHLAPGRFPMQWTFLTGKITREHQIEEHFLEYLRNIVELPQERAYLRELIASGRLERAIAAVDRERGEDKLQPESAS